MDTTYLTKDKYDEMVKELEELKTTGRNDVAERLRHAKELGDLSENSEYQEAREQQSIIEQKIVQLDELLRNASIIKHSSGDTIIKVGSHITVKNGSEEFQYTIVGSQDANPAEGKISNESPIGRSVLGLTVGDVAVVSVPKGEISLKILSIE